MAIQTASLESQVALVSGGARRVGAQITRALHAHGARVMIHYRTSATEAISLAAELNAVRHGSAATCKADLAEERAPDDIVGATRREFGRLDILVNNASSFYPTPVGKITWAQWDDLIGSNMKAPLFLAQAAAPSLREHGGLIVNMVDIHGLRPLKGHPVYSAAKAGLAMLTKALARELGPEIRVNGIAPGPVLWPEKPLDDGMKREIIDKTALKHAGSPADVAQSVLFFALNAPFVTGQILAVDGGRSI